MVRRSSAGRPSGAARRARRVGRSSPNAAEHRRRRCSRWSTSAQAMPTWSASTSRSVERRRLGAVGDDRRGPSGYPHETVSKKCSVHDVDAAAAQAPSASPAVCSVDPLARSRAARPGRGRRRTSRPSRRAAPAPCRCWTSPSRDGCAARGSAARAGTPGGRRRRRRRRRAGRAVPLEAGADGHEAGVRAAVEQRHAEALGGADGDVGAELAGRGEQGQGQQVRRHGDQGAALVGRGDDRRQVAHLARASPGTARTQPEELARPAAARRGRRRPPRRPAARRACAPRRGSAAGCPRRPGSRAWTSSGRRAA